MRVCLVARRFYESNSHMQQFARALTERGDTVDVIAARRPGLPKLESFNGVNVHRILARNADEGGAFTYLLKIAAFISYAAYTLTRRYFRSRYDLIHVQSVPDILVFSAIVPRLLGVPVILDLRDLGPELSVSKFGIKESSIAFRLLKFVERCCAGFASHVIVANPIWHGLITLRTAPPAKCSMMWYAPDPALFSPRPRLRKDNRFILMYPGTLSRHQGVDIAVSALPKILSQIPQAELHIYAEGSSRAPLAALADRLGVSAAVKFFDVIPTASLVYRMADADVAIVPKRASDRFGNEAASTKIPEFMAVGIPIVASRTAIETRLYGESSILYFRSEDEDDLVRAVLSVYSDSNLRSQLRASAFNTVRTASSDLNERYRCLVDRLVLNGTPCRTTETNRLP